LLLAGFPVKSETIEFLVPVVEFNFRPNFCKRISLLWLITLGSSSTDARTVLKLLGGLKFLIEIVRFSSLIEKVFACFYFEGEGDD
jgi:hypothetical protein